MVAFAISEPTCTLGKPARFTLRRTWGLVAFNLLCATVSKDNEHKDSGSVHIREKEQTRYRMQ